MGENDARSWSLTEINTGKAPSSASKKKKHTKLCKKTLDSIRAGLPVATPNGEVFMTFKYYDEFIEKVKNIEPYSNACYWPSEEELDSLTAIVDSIEFVEFLLWLLEKNGPPTNLYERFSKHVINTTLQQKLVLVDQIQECDILNCYQ